LLEIPSLSFNHGETRNLGAREANPKSQYIVYLSQDALPENELWLQNLIDPLELDQQVAGVFSRHVPRTNSSSAAARQLTTVWQTGGQEMLVKQMPPTLDEYEENKFYYIYFSNTSSAIRKSVWDEIPLRRTDFAEDAIWADEVLREGYSIIFQPSSVVIHSHDYNFIEQLRQNVDHTNAMIRLFTPNPYAIPGFWRRQVMAIPLNIWKDWKFTLTNHVFRSQTIWKKIKWIFHSPGWHFASVLGSYIGANLEKFPARFQLLVSRQERIRQLS
jgi:rhamnosyltransferase